jgi:hypothetical protein
VVDADQRHVWVLEEFDRNSGEFSNRYRLIGFSDAEAAAALNKSRIPEADLFDIGEGVLDQLAKRFGVDIDPVRCDYVIGREME